MSFSWQYPLFLLPHDGGYASLVDTSAASPVHALIVCTAPQVAVALMAEFAILRGPRRLHNDREFRWLLQSLKAPVTQVAFDPAPTADAINAQWRVEVADLLRQHLRGDNSPWNYPIFAIGQDHGFACIETAADNTEPRLAIGFFTTEKKAMTYLHDTGQPGDMLELSDMETTVTFLSALQANVTAVALDPQIIDGRHTAEYCLAIDVLLAKYLVRDNIS